MFGFNLTKEIKIFYSVREQLDRTFKGKVPMFKKHNNVDFDITQSEVIDRYIDGLDKKNKDSQKAYKREKRNMLHKGKFVVVPAALVLCVGIITMALLFLTGVLKIPGVSKSKATVTNSASADTQQTESASYTESGKNSGENSAQAQKDGSVKPSKIYGVQVAAGSDFTLENAESSFTELTENISKNSLTSLFISLKTEGGLLFDTQEGAEALETAVAKAHEKAISVFAVWDVSELSFDKEESKAAADNVVSQICKIKNLDGLMLCDPQRNLNGSDFKDYINTGSLDGYSNYSRQRLTLMVKELSNSVRKQNGSIYLGLMCGDVYATDKETASGMAVTTESTLLNDKNADVLSWIDSGFFDSVFVKTDTTTNSKSKPFDTVINWWNNAVADKCDLGFVLSSDLAMQGKGDWSNPDQLTRQLMALSKLNRYTFAFNSYSALKGDTSGGAEFLYKYLSGKVSNDYVLRELTLTSPAKTDFTVYEDSVAFIGASDPNFELTLNGNKVERTELGYFSIQQKLKVGKNTFTFAHKGSTKTVTVNYRYVVIKDYSPSTATKLDSSSDLLVRVTARNGSTVKAVLNGKTITLQKTTENDGSEFSTYAGTFEINETYKKDTSLGTVKFIGTHNGVNETFTGGKITVRKKIEAEYSPGSSGYIGVGNSLIAEVTKYQIETFDKLDDLSQPYNNYLPLGTVDYCSEKTYYEPGSKSTYRRLRYGNYVYTTNKGVQNIKTTRGKLPSSNKLSVKSVNTSGKYTTLTLKTNWKAPFRFSLLPQKYESSTGSHRGRISAVTFNYVDITFCYASALDGSLEKVSGSPVFSKAQVIKNTSDYTLRLYLKKTGGFYGWSAEYDKSGNLVFKFLNPSKAVAASNKYGGTLRGITVVVDAGHGGSDGGAVGSNSRYDEADRSLFLAKKVEQKLKSIGANVVMTRTSDTSMTPDTRILRVKNASPDLAVSIHRNSSGNSSARGFISYHFNAYTKPAAEKIRNRTAQAGAYTSTDVDWHYFYLSRITDCPVVLTENGFMSNSSDFNNMMNDKWNDKCADAIVKGIVDYFLQIK